MALNHEAQIERNGTPTVDQIHCVCYLTCAYLSSFRFPFVFNGAPLSSEHDVGVGVERHFVSTLVEQRELVCH